MNWIDLIAGFAMGSAAGAVFFVGLGLSVRLALSTTKTGSVLILSAAVRISFLLFVGWQVAQSGILHIIGFAAAFLLARFIAVSLAHPHLSREGG